MTSIAHDPLLPEPLRVTRIHRETHDVFTLELDVSARGGFSFEPGQFNMLYPFGVGESAISISGDPAEPERLIHTIRDVGTVTRALGRLRKGDFIGVRGPFGNPWPVRAAEGSDLVIMAGGIGLAPLRPVVYHALRRREAFGKVVLLYGTRKPADIVFRKEIERWRGRLDAEVEVTVDAADPDWRGHTGVVTRLVERVSFDPAKTVAMICGPEIMMRFAARELQRVGVPIERVYITMERNMRCGAVLCGHCQFGPTFVCKDGPVYRYDAVERLLAVREV
jgi:NAD(P)H-flavin reductase